MDVLDDEFITHETVRGKARLNCEEASRYCVEYGDVLFQRSSENQEDAGTSNVYLDQHVSSAFGGFVIRGKKVGEYNPIFIKYLLGSPFIREQITHRAQGAQHINVSQDTLADVVLLMPSMREQETVGLVFLHLDNLITLHQRKRCNGAFTHPLVWEQRKFSDMYEVNNERNTDCELGYDRTLSIATMTFNGGNGAADDSLNSYKVIRVGDIAFEGHANKVHAYGRFVLNDAGDGLMSPRFSCLKPIVEQRYSFWKYYISHEETMRSVLVNATKSGTMMNELVPDDLMRESILVPCLAEQEVIGDSLSQLDSLITLHQ